MCFPDLPFKNEFSWSGVFGKTKDSLPYIGNIPGKPRVFMPWVLEETESPLV